jgi:hypothetical protein
MGINDPADLYVKLCFNVVRDSMPLDISQATRRE